VRFWNHEVAENLDGVVQAILIAVEDSSVPHLTRPLRPPGRRGDVTCSPVRAPLSAPGGGEDG
jgi:hypothetical protein